MNDEVVIAPQGSSTPIHPPQQGYNPLQVQPGPSYHHPPAGHSYALPPQANNSFVMPPVPVPQQLPEPRQDRGPIKSRRKSAEIVRNAAQPFIQPRSKTSERTPEVKTNNDSISKSTLMEIIKALAGNNHINAALSQAGAPPLAMSQPRPSTSAAPTPFLAPPAALPPVAMPPNTVQNQPFPSIPGWSRVGLPARRLVDGVPTKSAKTPSFIVQHYSSIQQRRLSAITSINASNCRDSSYLRLMQKVSLDLHTVSHNLEVSTTLYLIFALHKRFFHRVITRTVYLLVFYHVSSPRKRETMF